MPLWNVEPARGEPARLGFEVLKVPVVLDTSLRINGDYGVSVSIDQAPQAAQILSSEVTIWGAPADPRHDSARGWACLLGGIYVGGSVPCEHTAVPSPPPAFLTLPTSCAGPLASTVEGESWALEQLAGEPGQVLALQGASTEDAIAGLEGCSSIPFTPSIHVGGAEHAASTPTGLNIDVHVPQQTTLQAGALGEADLKDTTVTLPAGMQLSPSAANGLAACSEQQVGYEGAPGPDRFAPGAPEPLRFSSAPAACPQASKVANVRVRTPLLEHELQGAAYLAAQDANPFGSLLALYIVAEDPYSGIRVKLAGEVKPNEATGQITATFSNTPQLPFEDFTLELSAGPRASLSTPPRCETPATQASFTPWSTPETATADVVGNPEDEFPITIGAGGSPCPSGALPFDPSFTAGSSNTQAGGYTPFTLTIAHPDGDQPPSELTVHLPDGVAAMLSSVTPCPEPPAGQEWSCGPESLIGHSTAWSGLGPDPVALPGSVYLTTGYAGAPFGLLVHTPAVAGPFNLGFVDVRSKILVNPQTAAVTVASDPFPQYVKGIPVQLKQLQVAVDRPGFEFNPTSCNKMAVTGTLTGSEGASAQVSSPFQVAGCQGPPFHPVLTASVGGHASRPYGDTFVVKLASAGLGQANIAKVDLQLPAALPSRQTTLEKACLAATFAANPASCSPESIIGMAVIHTPVLKSALSGPAYLVSYGGAKFPDVEFVLQGEGIKLVLDGQTDIKNGVTYSRFETAPDAPFTSFETVLPAGPHSALTAYANAKAPYDLCAVPLSMPTTITAQNGTVISQNTRITSTGCQAVKSNKTRKLTRAQLLTKALHACRTRYKHNRHTRAACERHARRRYAAKKPTNARHKP